MSPHRLYLDFPPERTIHTIMVPVNKSHHTFGHVNLDYKLKVGSQFPGRLRLYLASEVDGFPGIFCLIQHRVPNLGRSTGLNWKCCQDFK